MDGTFDGEGDGRTGIAAQQLDDIRQRLAGHAFALDRRDAVAAQNARARTGRVLHRRDDRDAPVTHRHHEAETAKLPFGVVLQLLELVGVEKFAVRVELADGALERGIDELLIRQVRPIHIFAADLLDGVVENLEVRLLVVRCPAWPWAAER